MLKSTFVALTLVVLFATLFVAACGNGDDDDGDCAITSTCPDNPDAGTTADAMAPDAMMAPDASPPDATMPDAAPPNGHVTIIGNNITGATGRVVLAFVMADPPLWGAVCVPATSDPMSFSAVIRVPADGNPCDLGAEVVFPDGTYNVQAGIFTPGQQTPDLCASTTVTVVGTGEATLPEFGPCL